jgi:hypothetical protein
VGVRRMSFSLDRAIRRASLEVSKDFPEPIDINPVLEIAFHLYVKALLGERPKEKWKWTGKIKVPSMS